MTVSGRRHERLADQIRAEVAEIINRELKDPRIGFATVTRVELAADYHAARVWVSVLGDVEAQEGTLEGLASAAGFLRREVGRRLRLRRVPEITFALDQSARDSLRIESLLEKVHREREPS